MKQVSRQEKLQKYGDSHPSMDLHSSQRYPHGPSAATRYRLPLDFLAASGSLKFGALRSVDAPEPPGSSGFESSAATCATCGESGPECLPAIVSANGCELRKPGALVAMVATFICSRHGSFFAIEGSLLRGPTLAPYPATALTPAGANAIVDLSRRADANERVRAG